MKTLAACIAVYLTAALVTFSQEPEAPAPEVVEKGLTLPAEDVEIIDVQGRKITVTILSSDANGITVKTADGKETRVNWDRLSVAAIQQITGKLPNSPSLQQRQQEIDRRMVKVQELGAIAHAANNKIKALPASEIHKLFVEKDEKVAAITEYFNHHTRKKMAFYKSRNMGGKHLNYFDIAHLMEVKANDVEEKVSLRPEFEKLGVKAREQEKNLCTLYSAQHLAQFVFLSKKMEAPTIEALKSKVRPMWDWTKTQGSTPNWVIVSCLAATNQTNILWLRAPSEKLTEEMIKHQIRNGRACNVSVMETIGTGSGPHKIVVVGFHSNDGKTTWEALNSNNVAQDNGYTTYNQLPDLGGGSGDFSIWIE